MKPKIVEYEFVLLNIKYDIINFLKYNEKH